jgi:hypothetical protein
VCFDIARKVGSGRLSHFPMTFDIAIEVPSVTINACHRVGTSSIWFTHDQFLEISGGHGVHGIYCGHQGAAVTCLGGEARCSTGAVQQSASKVTVSEHEHSFILLEGAGAY